MLARSLLLLGFVVSIGCVKITTEDERAGRARPVPAPPPAADVKADAPVAPPPAPAEAAVEPAPPSDVFAVKEPVAGEPVGVTVLDAGSEPRARLQLGGTVGQRRKLGVELGLNVAMQLGTRGVPPTKLPALQVRLDAEVVAIDADRTTVAIAVTEVIVPDDASSSTRVQQAIARTADQLRATKGRIVLLADGRIEGFELAGAAAADKPQTGLEPELGGLAAALQEMLPVVPGEPIGDGARWRSVQRVRRDTVTLQQSAEWTATREGDDLVLAATSEHVVIAPVSGVVEAQSGTTRARVVWDPSSALPKRAEAEVATTTRANLQLVGAAQVASMRVELSLRLADMAG